MASTPAPLPSLGLLDGLGTAAAGATDSPAPLPSLGLLGGLGTAAVVVEEPPLEWVQERIPGAWYVDPGFSALYAWHQRGVLVANRDEVAEPVGNQGGDPAPLPHLGLLLAPNAGITINGSVGAATAAGVTGTVSLGSDITINATPGSATAAGVLASLSLQITLNGAVGNASAAGVTGTVTLSGPEVFSAPPLVQRLESSTRIARASAARGDRLQSRNR